LMQLQKEDPKSYGLFIEGVMLLAYDIAWLCHAEGLEETPNFDGVCDIGKNLQYLIDRSETTSTRPPLSRTSTATTTKSEKNVDPKSSFGYYSHGSISHSLAGHPGVAMFAPDAWKVSVTTLTDRLKAYLRNEAARSEWDIIDETEWDEEMAHEQPVLIGADTRRLPDRGPAMSVMTVAPNDGAEDSSDAAKGQRQGKRRWIK